MSKNGDCFLLRLELLAKLRVMSGSMILAWSWKIGMFCPFNWPADNQPPNQPYLSQPKTEMEDLAEMS